METLNLSIGYSTCPNDTFIFDALINGKFDTKGLSFTPTLADVEDLNQKAFEESLDITKLSMFAYSKVADKYQILDSGSALGFKNGPMIISTKELDITQLDSYKIAIPGFHTTANFLLSSLFPKVKNKVAMLFSDIESAIKNGDVDAGVIIHETRFTYKENGFIKLVDLGERWEEKTGLPIPLGCIAIKRSIPDDIKVKVNALLKKSIERAFIQPELALSYCKLHAQDMKKEIMLQHIALYVNDFSISLDESGRNAIATLFEIAVSLGLLEEEPQNIFSPVSL